MPVPVAILGDAAQRFTLSFRANDAPATLRAGARCWDSGFVRPSWAISGLGAVPLPEELEGGATVATGGGLWLEQLMPRWDGRVRLVAAQSEETWGLNEILEQEQGAEAFLELMMQCKAASQALCVDLLEPAAPLQLLFVAGGEVAMWVMRKMEKGAKRSLLAAMSAAKVAAEARGETPDKLGADAGGLPGLCPIGGANSASGVAGARAASSSSGPATSSSSGPTSLCAPSRARRDSRAMSARRRKRRRSRSLRRSRSRSRSRSGERPYKQKAGDRRRFLGELRRAGRASSLQRTDSRRRSASPDARGAPRRAARWGEPGGPGNLGSPDAGSPRARRFGSAGKETLLPRRVGSALATLKPGSQANALQQLLERLRQDRNTASVIAWFQPVLQSEHMKETIPGFARLDFMTMVELTKLYRMHSLHNEDLALVCWQCSTDTCSAGLELGFLEDNYPTEVPYDPPDSPLPHMAEEQEE
ncbi:hypothetical protein WJX81_004531 [Elliptochloris bilobata]|uniref:Uncharacterized protein n=1 Tax=Elliptochloris bilobata TaxID=381761 RepID=A0AAW1RF67_9CHLO